MELVLVYIKRANHPSLEAPEHDLGLTGNNAVSAGKLQGHVDSVLGIFKIFKKMIYMAVHGLGAVL